MSNTQSSSESVLEEYKNGWRRNVINSFGHAFHTEQLDRFIELADLNGLFDPIKALDVAQTEPVANTPITPYDANWEAQTSFPPSS